MCFESPYLQGRGAGWTKGESLEIKVREAGQQVREEGGSDPHVPHFEA